MKSIIFILIVLNCFKLYASDETGNKNSPFKLVDMKCADDSDETLDTTPQSPPLNIDDPETPGCHTWEVNILVDGDLTKDSKRYEFPLIDLNYGIGNNIEVSFATPHVTNISNGETMSSIGKSEAGLKWMFYNGDKSKTNMAINPRIEFNADGSNSKGVKLGILDRGTTISLPFLISQKMGETKNGDIMVSASASYNKVIGTSNSDSIAAGAAIGFPLSSNTSLMAEINDERQTSVNEFGDRDQIVKVNVGFLHSINKQVSLFGSLGQSINSSDGQTHKYFLIGIKTTFGK
ncbi:MAG: hypothetical protein H7281_04955 [Bacteriovorax sp.]|nr:hypothetical protein [Bacteriovorax sp.]